MKNLLFDLFSAYYEARKNKRSTINQLRFELDFEARLKALHHEIENRSYAPGSCLAFIINKPVKREIFAADFRDRVVHHLIYAAINPIIDRKLIYDTYSCRKGKGTLEGINRMKKFMHGVTEGFRKEAWVLQCDISGYFMHINRQLLYNGLMPLLEPQMRRWAPEKRELYLFLIKQNVFNDPTKNCRIRGSRSDWAGLPKNKSLFHSPPGCGLPIGNLTSQLYGNVYLNEFDHYVKRELKIRYYGRYVDDFVLMHQDKNHLLLALQYIREVLHNEFALELHPRKIRLQPASAGVLFLGRCIKPWRSYAGSRQKGNFMQCIHSLNREWEKKGAVTDKLIDDTLCRINSYLGLMAHANSFRLREKALGRLNKKVWNYLYATSDLKKLVIHEHVKQARLLNRLDFHGG